MTFKVIDLYAGPGGWEQGVIAAVPTASVLGVEIDPTANGTAQLAGLHRLQQDVRSVNLDLYHDIDYVHASPPCQGLSTAGKGDGRSDKEKLVTALYAIQAGADANTVITQFEQDARSPLSVHMLEPLRWLKHYEPTYFSMEQVVTALPIWEAWADLLDVMGYNTWAGVMNSERYGVPQTRRRAILIASKRHKVDMPVPTHSKYHQRTPQRLDDGVKPWVSMADALGWTDEAYVVSNYGTNGQTKNKGVRTALQPAATVTSKADRNKVYQMVQSRLNNQSGVEMDMEWPAKRPALTIAGRPIATAPGTNANRFNGATKSRNDGIKITAQEAGILQGFNKKYPWQGTKEKIFEQIGNAVPPPMAAAVVKELLRGA